LAGAKSTSDSDSDDSKSGELLRLVPADKQNNKTRSGFISERCVGVYLGQAASWWGVPSKFESKWTRQRKGSLKEFGKAAGYEAAGVIVSFPYKHALSIKSYHSNELEQIRQGMNGH
jgi:hypothetical protein